jgi:nitrate/nitrite transporter NarK
MEINQSIKPQPSALLRWFILLLISLAMFGNYYIYDSISPLADVLKHQLGYSDSDIGLLNAIYSFPNIIMVLVGGIIIDKIGTRKSVVIFTFLIMLGAVMIICIRIEFNISKVRFVSRTECSIVGKEFI